MSEKFKAIVLNQSEKNFSREIKILEKNFFKTGDVLVKIDYSGLNYKDALILKNGATLVKEYPHIPGIDFSGKVLESENEDLKPGDEVYGYDNDGKVRICKVTQLHDQGIEEVVDLIQSLEEHAINISMEEIYA